MAYVSDANDPNVQQQPLGQNAPMSQLPQTATGGGGGSLSSPQGATSVPATTKAPPVQDLKAYLQANAPQAVQMGQNIAGGLQQAAGKVAGDINAAQNDLAAQINAQSYAPNTELVNQAAANPAEFVKNPQNVTDFLAQANENYTGPSNFESTPYNQTLTREVQNAIQQAPNINQPGGIEQLVTGQETNPTIGMRNLDTLLLQENPQAVAPIRQALPQFNELQNTLTGAQIDTNKSIQDAIAADQAARAGVQNTFLTGKNAVVPAFQQYLQNNLTQAQSDAQQREDAARAALELTNPNYAGLVYGQQPQVSEQTLSDLGLSRDQLGTLLSIQEQNNWDKSKPTMNLPTYLGLTQESPQAKITMGNLATPQDYAKEAALQQLLGSGYTNNVLNPADINQAGTANLNLSSLNPERVKSLLNQPGNYTPPVTPVETPIGNGYTPPGQPPTQPPIIQVGTPFTPNDPSTWDIHNPPPGYIYVPGFGWSQSENYQNPVTPPTGRNNPGNSYRGF